MRIGVSLPNLGLSANPAAVVRGAQHAEQLGYDTVWVADRLLYPVRPRNPYPATADGSLPAYYKEVLDPLESLTFAAAHTSRVGLGTSIIAIPFYGPVVLARRLTTIDVLSGGRLRVGFGLGWSVPPSFIGPKPIQKPRPPVFLAAYTASALKRVAAYADGWQPNGAILLGEMPRMLADLRAAAAAAGRDPSALLLNVVATAALTPQPITGRRAFFTGSVDQVREDIARARALGTTELIFELDLGPPLDELLRTMERFRRLVD
jgi:alkanesulfonate monooxygenase SsuD/methylene tetrahydromethanopterin reductase-like flavin-dependent oxidoreductase (luciferase family)